MIKQVRPATPDDLSDIMPLLMDVAALHAEGRADIFRAGAAPYEEDKLRDLMEKGEFIIFVATDGNVITGVLISKFRVIENHSVLRDQKTLWVEDTCVGAEYRGQGCGAMLLSHAEEFARINGCVRLELNVWGFNAAAREFYEKRGMREQRTIMEMEL